jgi:hypothetical protein
MAAFAPWLITLTGFLHPPSMPPAIPSLIRGSDPTGLRTGANLLDFLWDSFLTAGFELARPNCSTTRWRAHTKWKAAHNSQNQVYQNHVVRLLSWESVGIWRCLIDEVSNAQLYDVGACAGITQWTKSAPFLDVIT